MPSSSPTIPKEASHECFASHAPETHRRRRCRRDGRPRVRFPRARPRPEDAGRVRLGRHDHGRPARGLLPTVREETGIKIIEATPTNYPKLKAMVESGNVEWDVVDTADRMIFSGVRENLFEKLDLRAIDVKKIDPRYVIDVGVGHKAWSTLLSYSTRKYTGGNHPKSWAEFYDVQKF